MPAKRRRTLLQDTRPLSSFMEPQRTKPHLRRRLQRRIALADEVRLLGAHGLNVRLELVEHLLVVLNLGVRVVVPRLQLVVALCTASPTPWPRLSNGTR